MTAPPFAIVFVTIVAVVLAVGLLAAGMLYVGHLMQRDKGDDDAS